MDILTRNDWALAFATYYGVLAGGRPCDQAVINRGRDLFDTCAHMHPMTLAASEHRSAALDRARAVADT